MDENKNDELSYFFLNKNPLNKTKNNKLKVNQFKIILPKINESRGSVNKLFKYKQKKQINGDYKVKNDFYDKKEKKIFCLPQDSRLDEKEKKIFLLPQDSLLDDKEKIKRIENKNKYLKNGENYFLNKTLFRNLSARINNTKINNEYNKNIMENNNKNYYNYLLNQEKKDTYYSIFYNKDKNNLIRLVDYKSKNIMKEFRQLSFNNKQKNIKNILRNNLTYCNSDKKIKLITLNKNLIQNHDEEINFEKNNKINKNNNQTKDTQFRKTYFNSTKNIFFDYKTKLSNNNKLIYNDNFKNNNKNVFKLLNTSKYSDYKNLKISENNNTLNSSKIYGDKNIINENIKKKLELDAKNKENIMNKEKREKNEINDYLNKNEKKFEDENGLNDKNKANKTGNFIHLNLRDNYQKEKNEEKNKSKKNINEFDKNNCKRNEESEENSINSYIINEKVQCINFNESKHNNNNNIFKDNEESFNNYSTIIKNKQYIDNNDDEDSNCYDGKQEYNEDRGKRYYNIIEKIDNGKTNFEKQYNLSLINDDNDNINKNEDNITNDTYKKNNANNDEIHNDYNENDNISKNIYDKPNEKSYISNTEKSYSNDEKSFINNYDFN